MTSKVATGDSSRAGRLLLYELAMVLTNVKVEALILLQPFTLAG